MDKTAVFNYVEFAREELHKLVRQKAFEYGITEKGAESGSTIVNGRVLSQNEISQRAMLMKEIDNRIENKDYSNIS